MTFDQLLALAGRDRAPAVRTDSRLVRSGDIFVAVKGASSDGHDYIAAAVAGGAKYIVYQAGRVLPSQANGGCAQIPVGSPAKAAGLLAQAVNSNPAARMTNLAVTGTNGKTTVAFLTQQCIRHAGKQCGLVGTVVYDTGTGSIPATLTTPDSLTIADLQRRMVEAGAKYVVMEASSHALSQDRLAGINFDAAAFTNLTGDHLDYHKTKEDYLAAKSRLFADLQCEAYAILNRQSRESKAIAERTKARIWWYAIDEPADIRAAICSQTIAGTRFTIEFAGQTAEVSTPLLGTHNVANHLAAAGLCLAAGFDLKTVAAGLSTLQLVPGRLEKVSDAITSVIVDFAHTDDALQNVLRTLRPLCKGRLIVLFGCGGDRDKTKRPRMARVGEQLADLVVVTSDNPRTEDPAAIIADIVAGFANSKSPKITVEPDRRKAIRLAIQMANPDDVVLLAGKGHEPYQIVGTQKFDFSDKQEALACLRSRSQ
jgi:UDP-N-acetylmuramoyl-L-alanyl-D-glutamate--2,6-diaminopimelate ligase